MMQRPLLPLLMAVMAGICSGYWLEIPGLWPAAALIPAAATACWGLRTGRSHLVMPSSLALLFLLSMLHIGLYLHERPSPAHIVHYAGPDPLTVEGVLSAPPEAYPDRTQLIVSSQRLRKGNAVIPVHGNVLLNCTTDQSFFYGQVLRFTTRLKVPQRFQNPGGFDYERHLLFRGIRVQGFIGSPANILVLREDQGHPLRTRLEAFRWRLKTAIEAHAEAPATQVMQALILGSQKAIPAEIREQFNRTGTAHIIAISGFHVGVIAFFSLLLFRVLLKRSEYLLLRFSITKIALALSLIPIAVFALIAGMGISVIRAAIMALAFLVAILLGKDRDLYNTLALAGLIILVIYPPSLFDISFQLSFCAVAAILFIAPKLTVLLPGLPADGKKGLRLFLLRRLHDAALFIVISVSATLGTLPLVAFYFNRLSWITLLANLVVVPVLGMMALPLCVAVLAAAPISAALTSWLIQAAAWLVHAALGLLGRLAAVPWAASYVVTPYASEIAAYYLLLLILFALLGNRIAMRRGEEAGGVSWPRQNSVLLGAMAVLVLFLSLQGFQEHIERTRHRDLHITAIDVGQGGATFVRFPGGKNMLIDGGGFFNDDFDIGRYVVAPFLWNQRVRRVDIVLLTHAHPDHLNGLKFIVQHFDVGEVWSSGHEYNTESYQEFKRIIADRSLPHRPVSDASPPFWVQGVRVQVLNPAPVIREPGGGREEFEAVNNLSVVTRLTYGAVGILMPADISGPTEARLARQGLGIRSDVLFVPHHGGLTSSTPPFLDAVRPRIAVVSCGRGNVFRLPHPAVLERYQSRSIPLFRTDLDGAVTVATDGRDLRIRTFRDRQPRMVIDAAGPAGG